MFDLKGYVDRARLLNLSDGFLDEDNLFMYQDGEVVLYFHTLLNLLAKLDITTIEIPEGVTKVYLRLNYIPIEFRKKEYVFIFPSTLKYYGSTMEISKQQIGTISNESVSFWDIGENFRNSVFDFRKCTKLTTINDCAFKMMSFRGMYLPDTIAIIKKLAFEKANIDKFRAMGVKCIEECAFSGASVKEFHINTENLELEERSLAFESPLKELILKDISQINTCVFRNIERLYIPYDITYYARYFAEQLEQIADNLREHTKEMDKCHSMLYELRRNIDKYDLKTRYRLEMYILMYFNTGNSLGLISMLTSLYFTYLDTLKQKVYLYNSSNGYVNIKDREYKYIDGNSDIQIFLEM